MNLLSIFFIAIALTFDTFAVSVSSGTTDTKLKFWNAIKIAVVFGLIQAIMPLLGWIAGDIISNYLLKINHYIAFVLLAFIGIKMIFEAIKDSEKKAFNIYSFKVIITLGLITSIDALIVGFSFALMKVNIFISILIIGILTFLVAMIGMLIGKKAGEFIGRRAEILGGLILLFIGFKMLFLE